MNISNSTPKVFIIGLPRTATTSVCLAFLELGFSTAHTAYTQYAFNNAQVIGDTPIFCDYPQCDQIYPNSKFIYLMREKELWLPSIKQLLQRMSVNLLRKDGGFNPILNRCYHQVFAPFTLDNCSNDDFLWQCFLRHQQDVFNYFAKRRHDLLVLNVSQRDSFQQLLSFLRVSKLVTPETLTQQAYFPHINKGGKVTAWKAIKHPLKVESTHGGKVDKLLY